MTQGVRYAPGLPALVVQLRQADSPNHRYVVVVLQDYDSKLQRNVIFRSITMMPVYANKSFEELRFEDYAKGNKSKQQRSVPASIP